MLHPLLSRVGDTFPGQCLDVHVRAFIYRWGHTVSAEGEALPFTLDEVALAPARPLLRCVASSAW